jgi:hypothetical protein
LKIEHLQERATMLEKLPKHAKAVLFIDEDFTIPAEIFTLDNVCVVPVDYLNYDRTREVLMPGERQTA